MAKILIVDDVPDNIALLTFNLEDDGHEVLALPNGQECLRAVDDIKPDLILLDIMMPKLNGVETLKQLKLNPATNEIPVIMISANEDDDQVVDTLDIGAHDYVSKPFVYPILAARVRSALRLRESQQLLSLANQTLAQLASQDSLTGAYNRRYFFERVKGEINKCRRYKRPMALIMLDVDKFKNINDSFGHSMGDAVLVRLIEVVKHLIRTEDFIGRLGGEEFGICCPDTNENGASILAERIRSSIEKETITYNSKTCSITVSLGVTTFLESDENVEHIYDRADKLLYRAKAEGRNRIVAA